MGEDGEELPTSVSARSRACGCISDCSSREIDVAPLSAWICLIRSPLLPMMVPAFDFRTSIVSEREQVEAAAPGAALPPPTDAGVGVGERRALILRRCELSNARRISADDVDGLAPTCRFVLGGAPRSSRPDAADPRFRRRRRCGAAAAAGGAAAPAEDVGRLPDGPSRCIEANSSTALKSAAGANCVERFATALRADVAARFRVDAPSSAAVRFRLNSFTAGAGAAASACIDFIVYL